jgi:hypothetical protein
MWITVLAHCCYFKYTIPSSPTFLTTPLPIFPRPILKLLQALSAHTWPYAPQAVGEVLHANRSYIIHAHA